MTHGIGRRALFGIGLAALAGGVAVAQTATDPNALPPRGMMGGGMKGHGMMGGGMMGGAWTTASYLDSLKTRLAITPAQEPAWKEYADTVSSVGEQMQAMHQTMFDAMDTATWEERRDMMNEMFGARQNAFATVHDAAAKLLPQLDATQRARARGALPGRGHRRGMMRQP